MIYIYYCDIYLIFIIYKKIAINSKLLALMNIKIDIINLKEIKNKVVFSHIYDIRFQDLFLLFFSTVCEIKY